jgi:hypothetical protein
MFFLNTGRRLKAQGVPVHRPHAAPRLKYPVQGNSAEWSLHYGGNANPILIVIPDSPNIMWRIHWPDGRFPISAI